MTDTGDDAVEPTMTYEMTLTKDDVNGRGRGENTTVSGYCPAPDCDEYLSVPVWWFGRKTPPSCDECGRTLSLTLTAEVTDD